MTLFLPVCVGIPPAADYSLLQNRVTFNPGERQKTISVRINEDNHFDPEEYFNLSIRADPANQLGGDITITNSPVRAQIACESKL